MPALLGLLTSQAGRVNPTGTPLPRSGMHKVDKKALLAELVPARPAT